MFFKNFIIYLKILPIAFIFNLFNFLQKVT